MVVVFITVLYFNTITSTVVLVLMIFSYIFIRIKNSLKKRLKAHEDDVSSLKLLMNFILILKK